jgi:transposase
MIKQHYLSFQDSVMHQNILAEFLSEFGLQLLFAQIEPERISVSASPMQQSASCPECHTDSSKVHSYYDRTLADLSFGIRKVVLHLDVRRFFCINPGCKRATFSEPLPDLAIRYARRTNQLHEALRDIAFELGGEGGSKLARNLYYGEISPDTLLRIIRCTSHDNHPTPRYLGVDDWAMRKGRKYGTILVDLERHAVIDLLPDRTSAVLETWLKAHPGVELITRDRSGSYSEGATRGAPNAIQIADRFHLLTNLTETLKQIVERNPGVLKISQPSPASFMPENIETEPVAEQKVAQTMSAGLTHKQELYRQVQELHHQKMSYRRIAKSLGMTTNTAMKYANLPEPPAKQIRSSRKTLGFEQYIGKRWDEGVRAPKPLFLELANLGYKGSYKTITRYVAALRGPTHTHRDAHAAPKAPPSKLLVSQAAFLLGKPAEKLDEDEKKIVQHLCQTSNQINTAHELAQSFQKMLRERIADEFENWLGAAEHSSVPGMKNFAAGLKRDYQAVKMALSQPWSNGQVEGQVNRLKLIKRQMQGRAKLDLLRQRVIHKSIARSPTIGEVF